MIKKFLAMFIAATMCISIVSGVTFVSSAAEEYTNQSHMLKVHGNKLVWEDNENVEVVLSGVNVPGGEWTGTPSAEQWERNIQEAMNNWHCNVIRLAVGTKGWNGEYDYGSASSYRDYVKKIISYAEKAGKYVILDMHEYNIFQEKHVKFWQEAAEMFKNNPTVLFGILNEPTPSNWDIWRDGDGGSKIGHQKIVEVIRDTGARNIIVAGGRSYAKDTSGIVNGYALVDRNSKGETNVGNGIMYDTHWYAWHGYTPSWEKSIGPTRMQYPMVMGEFGWDANLNWELGKKKFEPGDEQYHDKWFDHLLKWFDDYEQYDNYMNFTAYSFHPSSAPAMLKSPDEFGNDYKDENYAFTPTDYHGVYIRDMLISRKGTSVALNKSVIDQAAGRPATSSDASFAIDDDMSTYWNCSRSGDRYFTVDLGGLYRINRYIARLGGTGDDYKNAADFQVLLSKDNLVWTPVDEVTNNESCVVDRYIPPTSARYIKFNITRVADDAPDACVYDFHVLGTESDGLDTVNIDAPAGYDVPETIVAKHQIVDFTEGSTMDDWSKKGYIIYVDGGAEDGVSPAMELSGLFGDVQQFGCSGAGTFGNFVDFDGFRFKYKSNQDLDLQVSLHYRASGVEKLTNTVTLPNTNGEWSVLVITPEELMPTPEDTWVKTDMKSVYNMNYNNYEPVVKLNFMGDHDFTQYTTFEYFEAIWYGDASYRPDSMSIKGSLYDKTVEVATRWQNDSGVMEGLFNFMGLYDPEGKLVKMDCEEITLDANTRSPKYYLNLEFPEIDDTSGYYLKVCTWRDSEGGVPVCETVTITDSGVIYGG